MIFILILILSGLIRQSLLVILFNIIFFSSFILCFTHTLCLIGILIYFVFGYSRMNIIFLLMKDKKINLYNFLLFQKE